MSIGLAAAEFDRARASEVFWLGLLVGVGRWDDIGQLVRKIPIQTTPCNSFHRMQLISFALLSVIRTCM